MRERALLMCFLLFTAALSGCFGKEDITTVEEDLPQEVRTFVTGPDGLPVDVPLLPFEFNFSDVGEDGEDGALDEGERNGKWDGYSMINCDPIVLTDEDGYARIQAVFPRELCIWQSTDDETGICTFEDFTASISSTLLIPQITTSDPLDIQLVRTQTTVGCP